MSKSNYGFILKNNSGNSRAFEDKYLELRKKLFGYLKEPPEARIEKGTSPKGYRIIHLKNAHLGLLMTSDEAEELKEELLDHFPDTELKIIRKEYKNAEYLQWYTSSGIVNNK